MRFAGVAKQGQVVVYKAGRVPNVAVGIHRGFTTSLIGLEVARVDCASGMQFCIHG